MKRNWITLAMVAAGICLTPLAADAQWGTLKGKFVYEGAAPTPTPVKVDKDVQEFGKLNLVDEALVVGPEGGVENVVIYCRTKNVKVDPALEKDLPKTVLMDNKGGRFAPHIVPVWVKHQALILGNSDKVGHNSNIQPLGDMGANPLIPPAGMVELKFNRSQNVPVPVGCNIHPWMKGYVLPRDNPYMAVSNADGEFEIKNLPAGELEFQAWQEKAGYLEAPGWAKGRFKATIKADETTDLGTIKLAPKLFEKS
jgi:hypothetical protein